ncbi:unnamed protein product [Triticum turgidum subsp. durum]|uniref:Uncharacterized protein n=1 Tax=Triticum turgidum subsp. durum TaxID=4567 RepID=A0A9R0XR70_TRITD|nr:unnamed protein product [Triticum turgidum subsp. durum]
MQMEMHQGSSSGCSDGSSKGEAKTAAEPAESSIVPVMVRIMAPSAIPEQEQRVPVDIAVVLHVHVRYNAPDKWWDLLMEAVRVVMDKLDERDHLAIVPGGGGGGSISKEALQYTEILLPMSSDNKASCSDAVRTAIQKCDSSLVRALESANSILYGQGYGYEKERRAAYIMVISNSQEDMSSLLTWRFRSVLAFGFRDARNGRAMHAITISRDCTYTILDDDWGSVTQAFIATVDRITSAAANMPVEVELECVGHEEVVITAVRAPHLSYFVSCDKRKIWATARLPGSDAATSFVVDMSGVPPDQVDLSGLIAVRAKYVHVPDDKLDRQAVTVNLEGAGGTKEVAAEIIRIKAIKIVDEISQKDETDTEKLHALAQELCQRWTTLKNSYGDRGAGLISMLSAEMREMEIRLYNNYLWLEYMLSWKSHQWWQLPLPLMFMEDPFLRLRIYAKVDNASTVPAAAEHPRAGLPVLLRIVAPAAGLAKAKRYPVDLVAVLDVSDEAGHQTDDDEKVEEEEEKTRRRMGQLKEAMKLVMDKLSHKDRLAIVPVQSSVAGAGPHAAALGLLEMSEQGRSEASKKVQSLVDLVLSKLGTASAKNMAPHTQTSHYRQQFKKSIEHVRKWLYIPSVNSNTTTSASTDNQSRDSVIGISVDVAGCNGVWKALVEALKILDDREETKKDDPGFVIVISNSNDESIPQPQEAIKSKYIIHTFSFHNSGTRTSRAMHYLASSSGGIYASLHDHRNQVTEAFTACIKRITSTIGVQTKVEITCSHSSISLPGMESGEFGPCIGEDGRSVSIMVGNLYAGTAKNFMFYVDNARLDDYDNLSKLLKVHVEWENKFTGGSEVHGQLVVVRNGSDGCKEMMEEMARSETGKVLWEIADSYNDMVAEKLHTCLKQASRKAQASGDALLAGEMENMEAILRRKMEKEHRKAVDPSYVKKLVADRLSNMLSWLSFHALSEQPPRIPWRSSFRLELLQNYPQNK